MKLLFQNLIKCDNFADYKSTRTAIGDALLELISMGIDVVALSADTSKSMNTNILKEKYPKRTYDCGIAEQNMMMVAAGLASTGKTVFAATYSTFTSMRILEQLRTFVCYPNLDVKILAGMGGLSGGIEGATHVALEDLGIVRCIPNLTVMNPADYYSTKKIIIESAKKNGPFYIRIGRDSSPVIFNEDYIFEIGKANTLIDTGNDIGIITNGLILFEVLNASKKLSERGLKFKLIEMPTLKPIDKEAIIKLARSTNKVVTIEEHNLTGGLYSSVCEVLSRFYPTLVYPIATMDIFSESGSPEELREKYKLDSENILESIYKIIEI